MMNDLVPVTSSAHTTMALQLLQVSRQAQLPATADGRPRTIFVARQQAAQLDVEALVACVGFLTSSRPPFLALCGGGASATYKAHPDALKRRFQVFDEALETEVVALRLEQPSEHLIAVFDLNRLTALVASMEMLSDFRIPVDLLYVAARTETRSMFVEHCRAQGIRPIVVEQYSAFAEAKDDRLYFPAIPRQLDAPFQNGEQTFVDLLRQATPAVIASYMRSASQFQAALQEAFDG